jgi:hypothetical protein
MVRIKIAKQVFKVKGLQAAVDGWCRIQVIHQQGKEYAKP